MGRFLQLVVEMELIVSPKWSYLIYTSEVGPTVNQCLKRCVTLLFLGMFLQLCDEFSKCSVFWTHAISCYTIYMKDTYTV